MTDKLRTAVESFSFFNGVLQETSGALAAIEQSALSPERRGRGNLYILVETIGGFPDHAQVQQHVINVAQQYFGTSGSVTAGIRAAIKTANSEVFDANLNAPREQRGVAGVTMMVLKGRDAYIGQLGPALLYHVCKGEFRRLPAESTWLTSENLEDVDTAKQPPLGMRREVEPELSHLYVRQGDLLVLASSLLAKLATDDEVRAAAAPSGAGSVRENLQALAKGQDVSALIVDVLGVGEAEAGDKAPAPEAPPAEAAGIWTRISSGLREGLQPRPTETSETTGAEEEGLNEEEGVPARRGMDLSNLGRSVWHALSGLGRGLATLLVRVLPESEPGQRAKRQQARRAAAPASSNRRWLWVALLIPVLVLTVYALTRYQYEHSRQVQFQQYRQTAEQAKINAQGSTSPAEQRAQIANALAALDQALVIQPGDAAVLAEKQALNEWLDRINVVSRIFYFNILKEFPDSETAKSQLGSTIVQGINVYVLDLGMNRVYKQLLNDARNALQTLTGDPVVVRKGDQRGNFTVDDLLDVAWVESSPALGTDVVFIMDKKGHGLQYDPATGLTALAAADTSAWRSPVAMAGYVGRMYLLDPGANRILRYSLTRTGYDGAPTDYLKAGADVSTGIDLAIDGNVYVLHSDGKISKYHEGASVPFPQRNLDEPLKSPCCIVVTGSMDESGAVYVVDSGNSRIVQFNKAGEFVRQLRSSKAGDMDGLRGLVVDEAAKKLYLATQNKLYWVTLPD